MTEGNVLKIGIASRDEIRNRSMAIASGHHKPTADEPKVWFTSMESLAQVLSDNNRLLLEMIARMKPASVSELATISGRAKGNLSRSLRTLETYGIVMLEKKAGGRVIPHVVYERFTLEFGLAA